MIALLRTAALLAVLAVLWPPASARAGYDTAQAIEKTCAPGGPLMLIDAWKRPRDHDRVITEPGEVIGCSRLGSATFQIAAAPVDDGGPDEAGLAMYFTVEVGDGADISYIDVSRPVNPVMVIRAERGGQVALAGVATADVPGATLVPIDRDRAARLGAARPFSVFSLVMEERALCGEVGASIPRRTRLVDAADGVPYSRAVSTLCRSYATPAAPPPEWVTDLAARLGSLVSALL